MHHPDIVVDYARDRQRELIAQVERRNLITTIRIRDRRRGEGVTSRLIETIGG